MTRGSISCDFILSEFAQKFTYGKAVDRGVSTVVFRYESQSFRGGILISSVFVLTLILLLALAMRKSRRYSCYHV